MQAFSVSPLGLCGSFWRNRELIAKLVKREVIGRYRGSMLGVLWSFFHPVLMLAVYTFVFSIVFKARWSVSPGDGPESRAAFALILFAGLLVYNLFAECVNRAPTLILQNANYVKRVVFPLEILPIVALGSALFHALVSLAVWLVFDVAAFGWPHASILLLPLVMLPLVLFTLGLAWTLASLGVFLRDIAQIVGVATSTLVFLTPIFYPVSALPVAYRGWIYANPLTLLVEQARDVMIWGKLPDWGVWCVMCAVGGAVACLGFAWFQKTRKGFADVL